jgi:hypothetical protein
MCEQASGPDRCPDLSRADELTSVGLLLVCCWSLLPLRRQNVMQYKHLSLLFVAVVIAPV